MLFRSCGYRNLDSPAFRNLYESPGPGQPMRLTAHARTFSRMKLPATALNELFFFRGPSSPASPVRAEPEAAPDHSPSLPLSPLTAMSPHSLEAQQPHPQPLQKQHSNSESDNVDDVDASPVWSLGVTYFFLVGFSSRLLVAGMPDYATQAWTTAMVAFVELLSRSSYLLRDAAMFTLINCRRPPRAYFFTPLRRALCANTLVLTSFIGERAFLLSFCLC